jgi:hypothetical protein
VVSHSTWGSSARQVLTALHLPRWISNLTVWIPLVFAQGLLRPTLVARAVIAFILLCGLSGSVYIIDDLVDRRRGLALQPTGRAIPIALGLAIVLTVACLSAAFLLSVPFGLVALIYWGLMTIYPLFLKQVLLINVLILASGLVLRTVAGAVAIDVPISPWLYMVTSALALFLALGQARHKLISSSDDQQVPVTIVGQSRTIARQSPQQGGDTEYPPGLWEALTAVTTATVVMSYGLYTFFAASLPADHRMMLTIPFVLYFVFRYLLLLDRGTESGVPERIVLGDAPLLTDAVLWVLVTLVLLYVRFP